MEWVPSTNTSSKPAECSYILCYDTNTELHKCTRDSCGVRYYCSEHWTHMEFLFTLTKDCVHCSRAHAADLYKDERDDSTVKYMSKWWSLCEYHKEIYDDSLDFIWLPTEI